MKPNRLGHRHFGCFAFKSQLSMERGEPSGKFNLQLMLFLLLPINDDLNDDIAEFVLNLTDPCC